MKKIIYIALILLCACKDPLSHVIPQDPSSWETDEPFKKAVSKLDSKQKDDLVKFLTASALRNLFNGGDLQSKITIGEAINSMNSAEVETQEVDEWDFYINSSEYNEIAINIKPKASPLRFVKGSIESGNLLDRHSIDLHLENKFDRKVSSYKGVITFFNSFDENIRDVVFFIDKDIEPGEMGKFTIEFDYNQFNDSHRILKNMNKQSIDLSPLAVSFTDGSKITTVAKDDWFDDTKGVVLKK